MRKDARHRARVLASWTPDGHATREDWLSEFDDLPARVRKDRALLVQALWVSIVHERSGEQVAAVAEALVARDPWHLPARLGLALWSKEGGRFPELWEDVALAYRDLPAVARAQARHRQEPSALNGSVLALMLVQAGLVGDARAVADGLPPGGDEDASALLQALTSAQGGQAEDLEVWLEEHRGGSRWLDQLVAAWEDEPYGDSTRALAAAARRRNYRAPDASPEQALRTLLDPDANRRARRFASRRIVSSPRHARLREACEARGADRETCLEAADYGASEDEAVTAVRIAAGALTRQDVENLDEDAFEEFEVLAAEPHAVKDLLDRLLQEGQLEEADAVLERSGAVIDTSDLISIRTMLRDRTAGPEAAVWVGLPSLDRAAEGEFYVPTPEVLHAKRLADALRPLANGDPAAAVGPLRELATTFEGRERHWLLAVAALAARNANDARTFDEIRQRFAGEAAESSTRATLDALHHLDGERFEQAARAALQALSRDPSEPLAFEVLWEAIEGAPSGSIDTLVALAKTAPPASELSNRALVRPLVEGALGSREQARKARQLVAREPDAAFDAIATAHPLLAETAVSVAVTEIREGADVAAAQEAGATAMRLIAHTPDPPSWHYDELGLALLTGQTTGPLEAVASQQIPEAYRVDPKGDLVQLVRARADGALNDRQAFELWQWYFASGGEEGVVSAIAGNPWHDALFSVGCAIQVRWEDSSKALPLCKRGLELDPDDLGTAINLSYAAMESHAMSEAEPVFDRLGPSYVEEPTQVDVFGNSGRLRANQAVYLERQERKAEAAEVWADAIALGASTPDMFHLDEPATGLLARYDAADYMLTPRVWALMAYRALRSGSVDAARYYADAALIGVADSKDDVDKRVVAHRHAFVDLARLEREAGTLTEKEVSTATKLVLDGDYEPTPEEVEGFADAHPDSALAQVVGAAYNLAGDHDERAAKYVELLRKRKPKHALASFYAMRLAMHEGELEDAGRIYDAAVRRHPGHFMFTAAAVPESLRGRDPDVPQWARARVATHKQADDVSSGATRRSNIPAAHEVYVPDSWEVATDEYRTTLTHASGARVVVHQRSRPARCEGRECAEDELRSYRRMGATVHWLADSQVAAGEATQAAISDRTSLVLLTVIPAGGRVFTIKGEAEYDDAEAMLAGVQLAVRSFRPLDGVLPAFRAESVRMDGAKLTDEIRLQVRDSMAEAPASRCPVEAALEAAGDTSARASVLVDAWLATGDADARAGLIRCVDADDPVATRLGVLAVGAASFEAHRYGREAVRAAPQEALRFARSVHIDKLDPALSSSDYLTHRDTAPPGLLEVALALPAEVRKSVVTQRLSSDDPRERALAWTLARLARSGIPEGEAIDALSGPSGAWALAYLRERRLNDRQLDRMLAQLEALPPSDERPKWKFADRLAWFIAKRERKKDRAALARVVERWKDHAEAHEELAETAQVHRHLVRGTEPSGRRVRELVRSRRQALPKLETPWRTAEELESSSLASLLPGRDWSRVRAGNPRLVATTARALLARLRPESATHEQMVKRSIDFMLERSGANLYDEDGALDVGRKIECASSPRVAGAVCVAHVRDADALLTALHHRRFGEDSGPMLTLEAARKLTPLPGSMAVMPEFLHPSVYEPASPPGAQKLLSERSRDSVQFGPHTLERQAVADVRSDRLRVDGEYYLLVGDRVFVFTTPTIALRVLHEAPSTLADDAEFVRLDAQAREAAGITTITLGEAAGDWDGGLTELVADKRGIGVRRVGRAEAQPDVSDLAAALPPGAVAAYSVGHERGHSKLVLPDDPDADVAAPPPEALINVDGSLAVGWYTEPGEDLWRRWVVVVRPRPAGLAALEREELWPGRRDAAVAHGQLSLLRTGDLLVVSNRFELLQQAKARIDEASETADEPSELLAHATFNGPRASAVIDQLPYRGELQPGFQLLVGVALGMVPTATMETTRDAETGRVTTMGRLDFNLAARGDAPELVDAWLASRDMSNSLRVPREVPHSETQGVLTYVLKVADPREFARVAVEESSRVTVATDDDLVRLTVSSAVTGEEALGQARRRRALAATYDYPAQDERVTEILSTLVDDDDDTETKVAAIIDWAHRRIDYEITPRRLTGRAVLDAGRGDCSEYAVLAVTLLRAAGIPAEERSGLSLGGNRLVAHAWIAWHDGTRWVEADPTAGSLKVTAGHVPLSILETLSRRATGSLEVVAVETP